MTLALGDALAMTVMRQKGFTRTDFGRLHPGGSLGARLKPVSRLMHSGDALPLTSADSSMHDTVVEMIGQAARRGRRDGRCRPSRRRHHRRRPSPQHRARPRSSRRGVHDPRSQDDRAGRAGRRGADLVRRIQDHGAVRGETMARQEAGRRAPHSRLPGRRDEHRHPDPGALPIVALSGKAAGRAEGRRRDGQAADPAQRRSGAAGGRSSRRVRRHRRRAHRRRLHARSASA